ncbi:SP0191 family lipoprotein [Streptococcus pseudopneumoniae]|uniref:SP0191 family lipoprotein n=1 Tax=Streptococcus pseudopneumoniae TaxID=257758 RepID=UPI00066B9E8E|nr:SP0191 family lipoprotein [Streptococcus pseudopneumoniae]
MKKVLGLIFAALLALAGCGQTDTATTDSSSTASSVDSSSQVKEEIKETTKVLKGRIDNSDVTLTLVYTDVVKRYKMDMLGEFGEEIPAEITLEEFQEVFREAAESSPEYLEIKDEPGVKVEYFITDNKKMRIVIDLDLEKADMDRVKKTYFFKSLEDSVEDFKKPNTLIAGLKLQGFREE